MFHSCVWLYEWGFCYLIFSSFNMIFFWHIPLLLVLGWVSIYSSLTHIILFCYIMILHLLGWVELFCYVIFSVKIPKYIYLDIFVCGMYRVLHLLGWVLFILSFPLLTCVNIFVAHYNFVISLLAYQNLLFCLFSLSSLNFSRSPDQHFSISTINISSPKFEVFRLLKELQAWKHWLLRKISSEIFMP